MRRHLIAALCVTLGFGPVVVDRAAAGWRADQVLGWTASGDFSRYQSAPATAVAGAATIVFETSEATGNTVGMPHTLTFDTTTPGYNHDVAVNILANPFDANGGHHEQDVTLTPGTYRYFCTIPGHSQMVGEFTVTDGGGGEDTTPPTVTAEVTGARNPAGDYVGSATVTLSASDGGSGVSTVEYQVDDTGFEPYTAPVAVTAPGDHSVQYRATDVAGNVSEVGSVPFRVVETGRDVVPPTVTAEVTGTRNPAGEYLGPATVTVTATDQDSGVSTVEYALDGGPWTPYTAPVVVGTTGPHAVGYRATDHAGNVADPGTAQFTVVGPGADACPNSDVRPTVVIGAEDTGIANVDTGDGCTVNDLIAEHAGYPDHPSFVRHVQTVTDQLVVAGVLSRRGQGVIVRAAARSDVGS